MVFEMKVIFVLVNGLIQEIRVHAVSELSEDKSLTFCPALEYLRSGDLATTDAPNAATCRIAAASAIVSAINLKQRVARNRCTRDRRCKSKSQSSRKLL